MTDPLERVIRPIVEGQIRGFLLEHPKIIAAVDWFKPRKDKSVTFVNSLSKRITLDLICAETRARIESALFEVWEAEKSDVALASASDSGGVGTLSDIIVSPERGITSALGGELLEVSVSLVAPSRALLPQIEWGAA